MEGSFFRGIIRVIMGERLLILTFKSSFESMQGTIYIKEEEQHVCIYITGLSFPIQESLELSPV